MRNGVQNAECKVQSDGKKTPCVFDWDATLQRQEG